MNGIGFGTWAWGNKAVWGYDAQRDDNRLRATFRQALSSGLNLIDTADSYGTGSLSGRSEALLGDFIAELPALRRSQLTVATKLAPFPWRWGRRGFDAAFESSRTRLKGQLRRVQLHWSTARYAPWQETGLLDGLAELVLAGRVDELGVSNLGPQRLVLLHRRLLERGVSLRSIQVQCSLLAPADDQLRELIAISRDLGVEVLAYSPLAFGVLGCAPGAEEKRSATWLRRRLFQRLLPASLELRSAMQAIANERGASMVQVALNWCRALGTTPIPGLRTPEQARDVAAALEWSMSQHERQTLNAARLRCSERMPANPFQSR
ncbi:pyridoxine 4-dehydrogenase [Synechococcus sp. A15-62]|nr:pyridoxine 4-dehydrogenase [Synechococcus sp. A15-62]